MITDFLKLGSFWRPQELANQFVHWFFGFWLAMIFWYCGFGYWSLLGGLIGLLETLRQSLFENPIKNSDWIKDKIRDNIFYFLGAFSSLIIKYMGTI